MHVPKIVHQVWFDFTKGSTGGSAGNSGKTPPEKYIRQQENCKRINPDYQFILWTDDTAQEFMATNFPQYLEMYNGYQYPIQRVDAIRYFLLYKIGGIYCDLDLKCLKGFQFTEANTAYLVEDSNPNLSLQFNNFLMASCPGHPFWLEMFKVLESNKDTTGLYSTIVLKSAGPEALGEAYNTYVGHQNYKSNPIVILDKERYNPQNMCGTCVSDTSQCIVSHDSDKKWTNVFEQVIVFMYCERFLLIKILLLLVITGWFIHRIRIQIGSG